MLTWYDLDACTEYDLDPASSKSVLDLLHHELLKIVNGMLKKSPNFCSCWMPTCNVCLHMENYLSAHGAHQPRPWHHILSLEVTTLQPPAFSGLDKSLVNPILLFCCLDVEPWCHDIYYCVDSLHDVESMVFLFKSVVIDYNLCKIIEEHMYCYLSLFAYLRKIYSSTMDKCHISCSEAWTSSWGRNVSFFCMAPDMLNVQRHTTVL